MTETAQAYDWPARHDCPRHLCGDCGRFVPRETVAHGGGYPDYEYWASGDCVKCGHVDVWCLPIRKDA